MTCKVCQDRPLREGADNSAYHLQPAAVFVTKVCAMTGPKAATWKDEKKIDTTHRGLCLLGTSSAIATVNEICTAPARPLSRLPPMIVSTFEAVAPMIAPIRAKELPMMKNHLRPKMSERRPTIRNPTARPRVYARATHVMLGDGPMDLLIRASEFEGRTQPM